LGTCFACLSDRGRKMRRVLCAVLMLATLLFVYGEARTEPSRIGDILRHENVLLPQGTPDRGQLVIIDYAMVAEVGGGVGVMIFYDAPRTKLKLDYLEVYDIGGDLLLVSWIDRYGVCQIAIDRALLNEDPPALDGILVLITGGTAL
jgi:hypothetical protein